MSSAIGITAEEADRRGSLYTEAILAEPSHVRLAINASHVYGGHRLDEVEAFDTLLVQVGDYRNFFDEIDESQVKEDQGTEDPEESHFGGNTDAENQGGISPYELRTVELLTKTSRGGLM